MSYLYTSHFRGSQLRHRVIVPARQPCSLACPNNNPMPELTLSPSHGSNSAAVFPRQITIRQTDPCHVMWTAELYSSAETPQPLPPQPPHLYSYTRALLVSQKKDRRHLLVTPCPLPTSNVRQLISHSHSDSFGNFLSRLAFAYSPLPSSMLQKASIFSATLLF
jgi:hypothetical protein